MIEFKREDGHSVLSAETTVPRPRAEVFAFFADAGNLQSLTPPWLDFEILTPEPIAMRVGALIDYRLRLRGIPVKWRTKITAWDPPARFVDEQMSGPYRLWVHEHTFSDAPGGTRVNDRVRYRVPGGWLVDRLMVQRELRRIFAFRQERLSEILA
jgi:hypothetical protein